MANNTEANNNGRVTGDSLDLEHSKHTVVKAFKTPKKRKTDELFPEYPATIYKKLMVKEFIFSKDEAKLFPILSKMMWLRHGYRTHKT